MKTTAQTVQAVNYLHEYAPQIIERVKNILDPFIGRDIFKTDGSLKKIVPYTSERISKKVPGGWLTVDYWIRKEYNYVSLWVKICYNGGTHDVKPSTAFCIYQDQSYTIYTITETTDAMLYKHYQLTAFSDQSQVDPQYNETELSAQAAIIQAKKDELNKLIDSFPYRLRDAFNVPNWIRS